MTEDQWLSSTCLRDMFNVLEALPGAQRLKRWRRKFRLWGCACCRLHKDDFADPRIRNAVEVAERLSQGQVPVTEVEEARKAVVDVRREREAKLGWLRALEREREPDAVMAALALLKPQWGWFAWAGMVAAHGCLGVSEPRENDRPYADLMRDVFGNPFHTTVVDPEWVRWNGGIVRKMAQVIYETRTFDRLPILADALEDAGCVELTVLEHCRSRGPHTLGCWVLDALLGQR